MARWVHRTLTKQLPSRPDPDVDYVTIIDDLGREQYVRVDNVWLPGDRPEPLPESG